VPATAASTSPARCHTTTSVPAAVLPSFTSVNAATAIAGMYDGASAGMSAG
jgi:hypothetical protein